MENTNERGAAPLTRASDKTVFVHSPGPWRVQTVPRFHYINDAAGFPVARVGYRALAEAGVHERKAADARLLAAAPLLLSELQNALMALEANGFTQQAGTARAAIAAATGDNARSDKSGGGQ